MKAPRTPFVALSCLAIATWVLGCTDRPATAPSIEASASGNGGGVTVTSTNPNNALQDTTLDVAVNGSGFDRGSVAQWARSGVLVATIHTNTTKFVSSKQLLANITISLTADTGLYDVLVATSTGKKGIGSELFTVKKGGPKPVPPADPAITYVSQAPFGDLMVMNVDGSNQATIAGGLAFSNPSWSPDARHVVVGGPGIWVVDVSVVSGIPTGSNLRQLTTDGFYAAWSPVGDTVAFSEGDPASPPSSLWIMPSGGGTATKIYDAPSGSTVNWLAWSPDAQKIAFVQIPPTGNRLLLILDRATARLDTIVSQPSLRYPDWSRGGDRIAYSAHCTCSRNETVYTLALTPGAKPTPLIDGIAPGWSPDDSKLVLSGLSIYTFATGAVLKLGGGAMPDWRRF